MVQVDSLRRTLPVATESRTGSSAGRGAPGSAFLSQLIAERHHLPPQRARRQAPLPEVLRTYDASGRLDIPRLPPGYRKSIEV